MPSILTTQQLNEENSTPKVKAGTYRSDEMGRVWQYVQASETITVADALTPAAAVINADVSSAAAADTIRVTGTGDFTTAVLLGMADPDTPNGHTYYLWIDAGATQGQGGPIIRRVSNDAVDVYWINSTTGTANDGKIVTALTSSSDYQVFAPSRVAISAAVGTLNVVTGFAQIDVTDEYWFWMLVKGMGICMFDGTTVATMGGGLIQGDTAGEVAAASSASADVPLVGYSFMDQTTDGQLIFIANCPMVGGIPIPAKKNAEYPGLQP